MKLSDEQRKKVAGWVGQGFSPSDVQRMIKEEFEISLTYLDLRLLLDDLKVVPKDPVVAKKEEPVEAEEEVEASGKLSFSVDQITRANAMVSGKVVFSDGQRAEWLIDTSGRPVLNPETPGYRPTQEDIMAFQVELQRAVQRMM